MYSFICGFDVSLRHELLELKETYEKEDSYDVI